MKFGCVIPARYGSTRLPGKPLADIAGKPMIERVYARVSQATKTVCTIVATDDNRVYSAVQQFGGTVMMTDPNHPTGTDQQRLRVIIQTWMLLSMSKVMNR